MDTAASAYRFIQANAMPDTQPAHGPRDMGTDSLRFFEDLEPGSEVVSSCHVIERDELVSFARTWDPLPFHVDEEAGVRAFGSITAPGLYMLAVKQRLIHSMPPLAVIASLGYDELRFHAPLRPGACIMLKAQWITRRESTSRPDRGLVTIRYSLVTGAGAVLMSHLDTVLVRRRFPGANPPQNSSAFAST
jgi:acyl dehydratase